MSSTEIERICNNDFDTLWNDLWIHTETINYRIKKEYIKSKNSFNNIKKGYKIKDKLINFEYMSNLVENKYTLNEWEIPKEEE